VILYNVGVTWSVLTTKCDVLFHWRRLFRLLICFIYNFTSRNYNHLQHYYFFTLIHANFFTLSAVVFAYSISLSLKLLNSLQLFFTCELPVTLSYRELLCSQSQSHFTTDSQSVCLSWCRAPCGAHDQIFNSVESYSSVHMGRPLWREVGSVICQS
jgi:hypothetical protein